MEVQTSPEAVICKDPTEESRDSFGLSSSNSTAETGPSLFLDIRPKNSGKRGSIYSVQSYYGAQPVKIAPKTILLTSPQKQIEMKNKKESRTRLKKVYFKVVAKKFTSRNNFSLLIPYGFDNRRKPVTGAGGSLARMNRIVPLCRLNVFPSIFFLENHVLSFLGLAALGNLHAHSAILRNVGIPLPPCTRRACNQVHGRSYVVFC
jgi:hypothetical protein